MPHFTVGFPGHAVAASNACRTETKRFVADLLVNREPEPAMEARSQGARAWAAAASLALHAALLSPILIGPATAERVVADAAPSSLPLIASVQLIDLTEPSVGAPAALIEPAWLGSQLVIQLPLIPPPPVVGVTEDSFELARETDSSNDTAEFERLQGLYVGQIKGRLSRVLEMVRASNTSALGSCEARVVQNEAGEVIDVDLAQCSFDVLREPRNARLLRRVIT